MPARDYLKGRTAPVTRGPTNGIEGYFLETHDWKSAAAFWKGLGFKVRFETDHGSGELRHPAGGPFLFIAERPKSRPVAVAPVLFVPDVAKFKTPPTATVVRPFTRTHWGSMEMILKDPDGRMLSIQGPVPSQSPSRKARKAAPKKPAKRGK